eukprot:3815017-Pleurochrysis_carterae.AAC.1
MAPRKSSKRTSSGHGFLRTNLGASLDICQGLACDLSVRSAFYSMPLRAGHLIQVTLGKDVVVQNANALKVYLDC